MEISIADVLELVLLHVFYLHLICLPCKYNEYLSLTQQNDAG